MNLSGVIWLTIVTILMILFTVVEPGFPVVKGGSEFCSQVKDALTLLEQKAPEVLDFINNYIKIIQINKVSGMCISCNPPTFQLSPKPDNMEKYWLASCLAHDSYHHYLYKLNKHQLHGAEPTYDSYSGFEAEKQCNAFQLQVLQRIAAPQYEIDYMRKQDGTHCDTNGDGVCDDKDYQVRQQELNGTIIICNSKFR